MLNITGIAKRITDDWLPPVMAKFLVKFRDSLSKKTPRRDFAVWWECSGIREKAPSTLVEMVDQFVHGAGYASASAYWLHLNRMNIEQIVEKGFENFQQTVARNYFTWIGGIDTDYARGLLDGVPQDLTFPLKELIRRHDCFTLDQSVLYNVTTLLLYEHVRQRSSPDEFVKLAAPMLGNPPALYLDGRWISQDVLNAYLEYQAVRGGMRDFRPTRILEIGAGGGRTAHCYLSLMPAVRYVIADIPPALYVSQTYLRRAFPDRRVFMYRPFRSYQDVREELEHADIAFLMVDQLSLLPDRFVDVFQAIDCLHEMRPAQIEQLFAAADRLADFLYFKCWQKTDIPFDKVHLTAEDYPVRPSWEAVFRRPCRVPSTYFEAMYRMHPGGAQ